MGRDIGYPFKLREIDLSTNDTVAHTGGESRILIQPEVGYVWEIVFTSMGMAQPPGSTAGFHETQLHTMTFEIPETLIAYAKSAWNQVVYIGYNGQELKGTVAEVPTAVSDQINALSNQMWCNNDVPIQILYVNDTDADQTGMRVMLLLVKEYVERL